MPHVELKYSDNLAIDVEKIFEKIERTINGVDPSVGDCKSRAYPAALYRHAHMMITIMLLPKKHRDAAFTKNLLNCLTTELQSFVPEKCYFSLKLCYADDNYVTLPPRGC